MLAVEAYRRAVADTCSVTENITLLVTISEPLMRNAFFTTRRQSLLSHLNSFPSISVHEMQRFGKDAIKIIRARALLMHGCGIFLHLYPVVLHDRIQVIQTPSY